MNRKNSQDDFTSMMHKLQYVTRALVNELDSDHLISKALETLNDLYQARRLSFLVLDPEGQTATVRGAYMDGKFSCPEDIYTIKEVGLQDLMDHKEIVRLPLNENSPYPIPVKTSQKVPQGLAIPLIGTKNLVIGFIIVDIDANGKMSNYQIAILYVLASLISSALENTRLFQLATIDALTGLYVRRYFDIRLKEEIARIRRKGGDLSLIMMDIDHFKSLNDQYGHLQGDMVLRKLAGLIRSLMRHDVDIACRYGGEEFVVILPETDLPGAIVVAERIRKSCEDYRYFDDNKDRHVTLSAGVASIDKNNLLLKDEFIQKVDSSLYEAKADGRNKVRFQI